MGERAHFYDIRCDQFDGPKYGGIQSRAKLVSALEQAMAILGQEPSVNIALMVVGMILNQIGICLLMLLKHVKLDD